MRDQVSVTKDDVARAISHHLPETRINSVVDKGTWIKRVFLVTFADGQEAVIKFQTHSEWGDIVHEAQVCAAFVEQGLPAPKVLAVDVSGEIVPFPFIIQERLGGTPLGELLPGASQKQRLAIFAELGRVYRRIHSVENDRAGLWHPDDHRQTRYPIHPCDYMYRAEIVEGSGKAALEKGLISASTYEAAVQIWADNLDYLKAHQPAMIHCSPFWWTIYLEHLRQGDTGNQIDDLWRVSRLMSLGDVVWWDPDYDLAMLRHPPFGHVSEAEWDSFLESYGRVPEERRLWLYGIMQRLCAVMGVYMEPTGSRTQSWVDKALRDLSEELASSPWA